MYPVALQFQINILYIVYFIYMYGVSYTWGIIYIAEYTA